MDEVNGYDSGAQSAGSHLGKRKRSASPEKKRLVNGDGAEADSLQRQLEHVLREANRSESQSSFLRRQLPEDEYTKPDAKRARLGLEAADDTTIEKRILSGYYTSQSQVFEDVARVREGGSSLNGTTNGDQKTDMQDATEQFVKSLKALSTNTSIKPDESESDTAQIIMLRSLTEKGAATLYSGMQSKTANAGKSAIDGRKLPNGFDLANPVKLDPVFLAPPKQPRKFADVFGPHRNTKALEMPRSRPVLRSNSLDFSAEAFPERPAPINRHDFRHQQLSGSSWLDYSRGHLLDDQDLSRKYRDKGVAANDFRAALIANDHSVNQSDDNIALFKKAFSSFAPVTDSSASLINDQDRNRSWWRRHGTKRIEKIFSTPTAYPEIEDETTQVNEEIKDDFEDVLTYDPAQDEAKSPRQDEPESVEDVLEDISQLLETVHSYQRIRSLETRQSSDPSKPTNAEFDAYEMLRSQLAILVASVPPFAVSKLDGEKLADLNISTNLTVNGVDYRGTMQADDATLAKYRAAQQAAATRMPQAVANTPLSRQPYPTHQQQPAAAQYANNLQAYAQNLGIQATAAQRQAQQYATPQTIQQRPNYGGYQQTPSHAQAPSYGNQPTVQQFQKTATPVNGYNGAWNTTKSAATGTPTPGTSGLNANYAQAPSQPGYQQRAAQRMQQQYSQYASIGQPVNGTGAGFPQYQQAQHNSAAYGTPSAAQQSYQQR